jgi:transposase
LKARGIEVLEVERPKRRRRGSRHHLKKSDSSDAERAARAVLAGEASGVPKSADGRVEMIRALRATRRSAMKARTQAANQLQGLRVTAPEELLDRLRGLSTKELVSVAARFRVGDDPRDVPSATKFALRSVARKVKGRKRHLLVDAQGLVLKVSVHSARVMDRDGIKLLLDPSLWDRLPRLSHLWLDAGYNGQDKGADWAQKVHGWTAEIVGHPPKPVPDELMRTWVREWAKEGVEIDQEKLQEPKDPRAAFLPIRWIVERTFSWLGQNRRMSKDYERLPESSEAFVYAAMSRLMVRRLTRA